MMTQEDVLRIASAVEAMFPPGLTSRSRGYTSFGGGSRLYAKLRELDSEVEFEHLIQSFDRIGHLPHFDQSLVLAIGFRESGPLLLRSSPTTRVDTFQQGGLDRLFREAPRLERAGFLATEVRRSLHAGTTEETEGSTATRSRRAAAALIPERHLLVAYGAVVADRASRFLARASTAALSTSGMDRRAQRIWTALFFGGPNGLPYPSFARQRDAHARIEGWMGSHFGAQTVISFLVQSGLRAQDITELHRHEQRMYDTDRIMSAFIVTAEAELLDWLKVLSRTQ